MQEITSRKNPLVQHLKQLGTDRAYREATGEFLCDGLKLYEEAVQSGAEITLLAASRRELLDGVSRQAILVPEDVLASISPMKTPQPLLFACKKPDQALAERPRRVLVLDGVQDPGNVGTLLRSARAFSVDQVILVGACADLYHPRTVRAAMGALFRQRVVQLSVDEMLDYVNLNDLALLGADLAEDSLDLRGTLPGRMAVVIGSEGQGLSETVRSVCYGTVRIPMEETSESLNAGVAGSILLWEMYRRQEEC
ncbi:MAG: RNA methyltransferase [Oscillospiraceae bacterium]|nr:RNA methyltransferase [Oscillospiraceae bacterium]